MYALGYVYGLLCAPRIPGNQCFPIPENTTKAVEDCSAVQHRVDRPLADNFRYATNQTAAGVKEVKMVFGAEIRFENNCCRHLQTGTVPHEFYGYRNSCDQK